MIRILILSALAMQSLALKCYAPGPSPNSPPIRFDQDIPDAQLCGRYEYKEPNSPSITAYTAVKDQQTVDYLKAIGSNVYACKTDFCNGPVANSDSTTQNPTTKPSGLKCYVGNNTIMYQLAVPGATVCIRYDQEPNNPKSTLYSALLNDKAVIDDLKRVTTNVYACSTDLCNGPDAPASGTQVKSPTPEPPVASPIVSPKASPTALVKSGADRVMDRSVFAFMFALLFVVY